MFADALLAVANFARDLKVGIIYQNLNCF